MARHTFDPSSHTRSPMVATRKDTDLHYRAALGYEDGFCPFQVIDDTLVTTICDHRKFRLPSAPLNRAAASRRLPT